MPIDVDIVEQTDSDGTLVVLESLHFLGAIDENAKAADNPITLLGSGTVYSYEKTLFVRVNDLDGFTSLSDIKVYFTAAFSPTSGFNVTTNAGTGGSYSYQSTWSTPVNTVSSKTPNNAATSDPGAENLGISGALGNSLTAAGTSDQLVMQASIDQTVRTISQMTLRIEWDENP